MSTITLTETGVTPSNPSVGKRKLFTTPAGELVLVDSTGTTNTFTAGGGGGTDTRGYEFMVGPDPSDPYNDLDSAIAAASLVGVNVVYVKASTTPYTAPVNPIPDGMRIEGLSGSVGLEDINSLSFSPGTGVPVIEGPITISTSTDVLFKNIGVVTQDNSGAAFVIEEGSYTKLVNCAVSNPDFSSPDNGTMFEFAPGAGCNIIVKNTLLAYIGTSGGSTLFDMSVTDVNLTLDNSFLFGGNIFSGANAGGVNALRCNLSTPGSPTPIYGDYEHCELDLDASITDFSTFRHCEIDGLLFDFNTFVNAQLCQIDNLSLNTAGGSGLRITDCQIEQITRFAECELNVRNCTVLQSTTLASGGAINAQGVVFREVDLLEPGTGSPSMTFSHCVIEGNFSTTGTADVYDLSLLNSTVIGDAVLGWKGSYQIENCTVRGDIDLADADVTGEVDLTKADNITNTAGALTGPFVIWKQEDFDSIAATIPLDSLRVAETSGGVVSVSSTDIAGLCDSVSAPVSIELPPGLGLPIGKTIRFVDNGNASGNNITFGGADTPVNASAVTTDYAVFYATWDGTNWVQS